MSRDDYITMSKCGKELFFVKFANFFTDGKKSFPYFRHSDYGSTTFSLKTLSLITLRFITLSLMRLNNEPQ
jgi:hypothetical protein